MPACRMAGIHTGNRRQGMNYRTAIKTEGGALIYRKIRKDGAGEYILHLGMKAYIAVAHQYTHGNLTMTFYKITHYSEK